MIAQFFTDNILPLAIVIFSGWMLFEFLALCHAHRRFRRMREDD